MPVHSESIGRGKSVSLPICRIIRKPLKYSNTFDITFAFYRGRFAGYSLIARHFSFLIPHSSFLTLNS